MGDVLTTVYLKASGSVELERTDVTAGDVFEIECSGSLEKKDVEKIPLFQFQQGRQKGRKVLSVLEAVKAVHSRYPDVRIINMGSSDIVVTFRQAKGRGRIRHALKTAGVVLVVFAGAAFSIMAFHNDIDITGVFGQIYQLVTGKEDNGFTVLEVSYSAGLAGGILIFFNHFGKKRFSEDPTPIEVQMRSYEEEICSAVVEAGSRKEKKQDVVPADHSGGCRS